MAGCDYKYNGTSYNEADFKKLLADGELDNLISNNKINQRYAFTKSQKEFNEKNTSGRSVQGNLDNVQREQEQTQGQETQQGANDSNRSEAGGTIQSASQETQNQKINNAQKEEAQAQVVTLADRAQAARQGIQETPATMQERLQQARQDTERQQQREAERQQRRNLLYPPEETAAAPAPPTLVTQNENGATVAAPAATTEAASVADAATPAATPDMKTIDGVYQFGAKQNVRIADISNSNDFRGPRRVSKDAVKYLRQNRGNQEVLLYRHPNGKIYVLDGKAAIEAQKANRRATVPARFFNGTAEQAAEVAHLRKPQPPQQYIARRADRVLAEQPRTFEEYALQTILGIMRKVGNKPAFSLADFARYSGFGGTQTSRLRMNYGQTIGENDIKDLRSRGVISSNKDRRIINFDLFAKEWMDRPGNEGEDEGDLINQLTDLLQNYQSPEKIIGRLEDSQGVQEAPLNESLLPFHVTPEEAIYIAENNLHPTLQAILHNYDEIPEVTGGEQEAFNNLVTSHTAPDGVMDINGIFNTLTTADDANLQSLREKLATYATRQSAAQATESHGDTGGKIVFERSDGTLVESDDNGDFFSRWNGGTAEQSASGQSLTTKAAQRIAGVFKQAFTGLQVSFDRSAFQNALRKAIGGQNSRQSERAVYLHDQLQSAQNELKNAQDAMLSKRQQLDRSIQQDQQDLFGNRPSASAQNLFNERVDQAARDKAMKPFLDRVANAKENVNKLNSQLSDELKKATGEQQQSLFSKEAKPTLGLNFINDSKALGKTTTETITNSKGQSITRETTLGQQQTKIQSELKDLTDLMDCLHG